MIILTREELEQKALKTVSANNYYDMADNISNMSDNDIYDIISCNGDYVKECNMGGVVL